jgi:putative integral membrane protein (TIGR02587 family)
MPLLYTMEVWWWGFLLPWWKALLLLAVTAAFVVAFSYIEGFRRDRTLGEAAADSVVDFGLGIVLAAMMLLLLGQLDGSASLREWVGKIALEAVPVAIGASVARGLLGESALRDVTPGRLGPLAQVVVAAGGALFFALNVAPTEEPVLIGIGSEWWLVLLQLGLAGILSFGIVFFADFRGSHRGRRYEGALSPVRTPLGETAVCLVSALAVSALLLWLFDRIGAGIGFSAAVRQVVALGFVAAIGSSAARLLL